MTDIVERLRKAQYDRVFDDELFGREPLPLDEAANEIERLREKCDRQAMILRRLTPENFPNTCFICGEAGERDQNSMPKKILVAPAYGVDFAYEYEYNGRVTGPEW